MVDVGEQPLLLGLATAGDAVQAVADPALALLVFKEVDSGDGFVGLEGFGEGGDQVGADVLAHLRVAVDSDRLEGNQFSGHS